MNAKKIVSILTTILFFLGTAILYNNCEAPFEPISDSLSSAGPKEKKENQGKIFFDENVLTTFNQSCVGCHSSAGPGPTSIFNYSQMRAQIAAGPNATNNPLFNKLSGVTVHSGGNLCPVDKNVSPCKEVADWSAVEFPLAVDGMAGQITEVDALGRATAWILDTASPNETLEAFVYIETLADQGGILVGQYTANELGAGNAQQNHYFSFQLPEPYRNGQLHNVYVYGRSAEPANLIRPMPARIGGFSPSAAGQEYYENSLRAALTSCAGCHIMGYEVNWLQLAMPGPFSGGTALNNLLIDKARGINHPGGNQCPAGVDSGPCAGIQTWWSLEFGL